jgi:hypothetical protein
MSRVCAFCNEPKKLTREHVFPLWLSRGISARGSTSGYFTMAYPGRESWRQGSLDWQVKQVCRDCNSGWMSGLEASAGPILLPMVGGLPRSLSQAEQSTASTWAVKTIMTADLLHAESIRAIPPQDRWTLFRLHEPPPGYMVWLSAMDTKERIGSVTGESITYSNPVSPDGPPHKVMCDTLRLGQLVLQVMSTTDPQGSIANNAVELGNAFQIWPRSGELVHWPPPVPLWNEALAAWSKPRSEAAG